MNTRVLVFQTNGAGTNERSGPNRQLQAVVSDFLKRLVMLGNETLPA